MSASLRYLLFQVRNPHDPMRGREIQSFAWALGCEANQIQAIDLMQHPPSRAQLSGIDVVLIGGSGDYSVPEGGPWLEGALDTMRELHATSKPTFASCWGFQAMAQALGGLVITDEDRAEIGTMPMHLTEAGISDAIFGPLGTPFLAHIGHHDTVERLPPDAILLASTDRVDNHAFRFRDKPIYCTQFHSELQLRYLVERLEAYPAYVEKIAGMPYNVFVRTLAETPESNGILARYAAHFFGD